MLSQYHTPLNSTAAPFFQPPKSPVGGSSANLNGASINSIIGNGDAFGMKAGDVNGPAFGAQANMGINTGNTTGFLSGDASVFNYNPQAATQSASFGMLSGNKVGGNAPSGGVTQGGYQILPPQTNTAVYQPQMSAQMPQLMMQQAPMAVPAAMQATANPQQSQGAAFFMQPQQMFMNNNGQTMFFRTGKYYDHLN